MTYKWGGIVKIHVQSSTEACRLVFYGAPKLLVTSPMSPPLPSGERLHWKDADFAADSVAAQGGLRIAREV